MRERADLLEAVLERKVELLYILWELMYYCFALMLNSEFSNSANWLLKSQKSIMYVMMILYLISIYI